VVSFTPRLLYLRKNSLRLDAVAKKIISTSHAIIFVQLVKVTGEEPEFS
jgi:RNA-binding protein YlmH